MAESDAKKPLENEADFGGPKFSPTVCEQRYRFVIDAVKKHKAERVADFGCAEARLLRRLKTLESVEYLAGVDIRVTSIDTGHLTPNPVEWMIKDRPRPLQVQLFKGSVSHPDSRLFNLDLVSCIELVEHLDADVLADLPHSLFGQMQPRLAIVSTPNSDFNVLFPNFQGRRHWDHKFEWSRSEFKDWAGDVVEKYNYDVTFTGVGEGMKGAAERYGYCSQIAIFTRTTPDPIETETHQNKLKPYECVFDQPFPYQNSASSQGEKLYSEIQYLVPMLARDTADDVDPQQLKDSVQVSIPIEKFLDYRKASELCDGNIDTLRKMIAADCADFVQLSSDRNAILYSVQRRSWDSADENDGGEHDNIVVCPSSIDSEEEECWE